MYQDQEQDGPNTLKETEAQERAKHFSAVSYDLSLNLQPNQKTYRAVLKITFNFKGSDDQNHLFLDFVGKTIESFKVNGKAVSENPFKRNRVFFKKEDLNNGSNVVEINYVNNYDKSGAGFHQFIDPVDNEEYLYTNFEPFDAHRWLPCFEQPDIKGKIKLTVKAPEKWKVLANGKKIDLDTKDGFSTWKFEETPAISTYLFACVVGPYDEFTDNYDNRIPLGLYVRKSLSKHLDKDVFFQQTKQGFGFYEKFFEYQYPFSKYDQVFVPEFNAGAMENVGCVTFTEHYIFRDPPTKSQVANRADTILHEMAHMWFGDLVSPVWWDGLWLNESFATYMAALCVAEATEFGNLSWQNFNSGMKAWAYREDQLSTTHPIQGTVADTDQTFLNFDGITYGKGASLLKQLVYVIGKDSFQKGLSHYFKKHEWGNTTIQDFLLALSYGAKQCGFDYDEKKWSSQWLETAGLNSFLPHIESSEDGTIKSLVIEQEHPPEHPTYRNHTTEIVFVNWDASKNATTVEGTFRVEVLAQKETPVGSLVGKKRPDFVFLNYNDHAFVKCLLDDKSELFARTHLEKLSDPFLRQLLWDAYYNMARDGKMLSKHYLALVTDKIKFETDPKLIQTILRRASGTLSFFIPDAIKLEESQKLFDLSLESLKKSPENSEQAIIWARSAIDFAKTKESVATLVPFLEPGKKIGNYTLDQSQRWSVVLHSIAWDIEGAKELLEFELKKDPSDKGQRIAAAAKSSIGTPETKEEAWKRYLSKDLSDVSNHMLISDMSGFSWFHQRSLVEPYGQKFFSVVRSYFKEHNKELSMSFFNNLFPFYPENPEIITKSEELLASLQPEEQILRRCLKEQLDDLRRASKCRALYQKQ